MRTRTIQHGKTELWVRFVQAVAVAGLCFSIGLSVYLHRVEEQFTAEIARAQEGLVVTKKHDPTASVATVQMTTEQISRITGQTEVLNRILSGGIVFSAKRAGMIPFQTDFDRITGDAL